MAHALRTGYDTFSMNRLDLTLPEVYLRLQFRDPLGATVNFPSGVKVTVEYGDDTDKRYEGETIAGGQLRFTAAQIPGGNIVKIKNFFTIGSPWKTFTLLFDTNATQYVVCSMTEPAVANLTSSDLTTVPSPPAAARRYFNLPRKVRLKRMDLNAAPTISGAQGTWNGGAATITFAQNSDLNDIGTALAPIDICLKPVWLFLRYEYYDRWFGPSVRTGGAAGIGAKSTIPPIEIEGFRTTPDPTSADPQPALLNGEDSDYTQSNWTVADGNNRVQCIPWFRARKSDDTAVAPFLGSTLGLRFKMPDNQRFVYSVSATVRNILNMNPDPLPGPQRLRYYRLPQLWKSKNWYTRNVGGNTRFFGALSTGEFNNAVNAGAALLFWLDDLILTDNTLAELHLAATDRVAIYHHRFSPGANMSNEGVWKPGTTVTVNQPYPWSDVVLEPANKYGGSASERYYITDYPDWARIVLAQGNVFDAFDTRTTDTCSVVGARAAVRWIDATTAPNGVAAGTSFTARPAVVLQPSADNRALFAIQTFYWQHFMTGYGESTQTSGAVKHNEWTASYSPGVRKDQIGRFDMVHVRCADVDRSVDEEVSVVLRYHRLSFDFTSPESGTANPALASPAVAQAGWIKYLVDNSLARWNGFDAINASPTWVLPTNTGTPPIRMQVVTLFQHLKQAWSHFYIKTIPTNGRSGMGEIGGTGTLRINCVIHDGGPNGANDLWGAAKSGRGLAAAHELGHCGSLPDEYINDSDESMNVPNLCLLGAPYVFEQQDFNNAPPSGSGLMHGNWWLRARYFWHVADWLRLVPTLATTDMKVQHPPENDFRLPHYPRNTGAGFRFRHFVNWPVSFNFRASPLPNTLFDSVAYMFGDDLYSSQVLVNKMHVPPGGRIDGMVTVLFRIKINFSGVPGGSAARIRFRDSVFTLLRDSYFTDRLCFRRVACFQISGGSRHVVPYFDRCLVHFVPGFYTAGTTDNSDATLMNDSPAHMTVNILSGSPPPAETWNAVTGTQQVRVPQVIPNYDAEAATVAGKIWNRALERLGLTVNSPPAAGSYFAASSYSHFVSSVMDVASPPSPPAIS